MTWIIKFATDDPKRALANFEDQRSKGYTPWIEDENGAAIDEQSLKTNGLVTTKRTLTEGLMGPVFVVAWVAVGVFVLYLIGLWVDRY